MVVAKYDVKIFIYHTGMCIKGPKSWWIVEIKGPKSWLIAKSITISRVVNQSKVHPQRTKGVVDGFWIDLPRVEEL